jgi:hypothetical protein
LENGEKAIIGKPMDVISSYVSNLSTNGFKNSGALVKTKDNNFILEKVVFEDFDGNEKTLIQTGDEVLIKVFITSEETFSDLVVSIGVNDQYNHRITVLHSKLSGFRLEKENQTTCVNCKLERMQLLPGNYNLDIKIYRNGNDPIIWAPNLLQLSIEEGKFQEDSKLPPKGWGGYFVLQQDWFVHK